MPLTAGQVLVRLPHGVLSHATAARAWGIALVDDDGAQHLTVPRNHSRRTASGWTIHRALLPDGDLVHDAGARLTSPVRTVRDLAAVLPLDQAVAAADSAVGRQLPGVDALVPTLRAARGRGARAVWAVADLVDPLSESVLESLLRVLLIAAGLVGFVSQYEVRAAGRLVARADFCWPRARLIVEADGFAFHSDRAAYRRDRERMNELERLGWRVLRFTWEDVRSRPHGVVATVSACLAPAA